MFAVRTSQSRQRGFLASVVIAALLSVSQISFASEGDAIATEIVGPITPVTPICCVFPTLYTPATGLWVIDAENNGTPGRGFNIEIRGGFMVFTYYGYTFNGPGAWYQATGAVTLNQFTGTLAEYGGGAYLGPCPSMIMAICALVHTASHTGDAGSVTIDFTSNTTGTITLPGQAAVAISKFTW